MILDFSKAFDKVVHGVLLHKLKNMGISVVLGKWIYEFLDNGKLQVKLKNGSSQNICVLSRVPQGTVIAPVLFLILMSDISHDHSSDVICVVDDTPIFRTTSSTDDSKKLHDI